MFRVGDIVEVAARKPNVEHSWGMVGVVTKADEDGDTVYANVIVKPPTWRHKDFHSPPEALILRGHADGV